MNTPHTTPEGSSVPEDMTAHFTEPQEIPVVSDQSRIAARFSAAKTALEIAILTGEVGPANEAVRGVAYAASIAGGAPPLVSGLVLGASTLIVEGGAAWATADLLDTNTGGKVIDWVNQRLKKVVPEEAKMSPIAEAGVAMLGGTAVVLAEKHREDPSRTREQNQRHGFFTAAWMSGVMAVEGALAAEGIAAPQPTTIGAAVVGAATLYGAYRWSRNKLKAETEKPHKMVSNGETPQRLGLSQEDKDAALEDERTIVIEEEGKQIPVLVPIDRLYWYNKKYLSEHFGTDEIYYYAHPDLADEANKSQVYEHIRELTDRGGVILYDTVTTKDTIYGDLEHELLENGARFNKVPITKDGRQRFLNQYDGKLVIKGERGMPYTQKAPLYEAYQQAIEQGAVDYDAENGPTIESVIEGEEAERLYKMYRIPFDRLSDGHPINAGYNHDEFIDMMKDPETVKAVYRINGEIETLALFLNDLDHCTWLDKRYYESNYKDVLDTGNNYVFPGIVTNELKRGARLSVPLIQLLAKVQAFRGSPCTISFECTDISYKYIPKIVRFAIGRTGVAKTEGLKEPVSRLDYYAITGISEDEV